MRKMAHWLFPLLLGLVSHAPHAEIVALTLPSKLVAKAEFRQGEPHKPAVILLHGFLQTHTFPTIDRLTESLAGEGYTVLAPTLSLGVPHRGQSMACEAIHTHTVAGGVAEIDAWVKWLKTKKMKEIILGGHSLGNVYYLDYLNSRPDRLVSKFIGISILEGSLKAGEDARPGLISKLRDKVRGGGKEIMEDQFSFCQKFCSTPDSLLSYLEWGPDKILAAIDKPRIPVTMIMGGKDDRLGKDWLGRLKKTRAKVILIEGANHFMDGQHEFDLMDHFLAELKAAEP